MLAIYKGGSNKAFTAFWLQCLGLGLPSNESLMRKNLWILVFCCLPMLGHAQEAAKEALLQQLLEYAQEDADYSQLYEYYTRLLQRPLPLNTATEEDLQSLQLLSEQQIHALLMHRKKYGKLLSIYELQSIASFDKQTIDRIMPIIRLGGAVSGGASLKKNLLGSGNNHFLLRNRLDPSTAIADTLRGIAPASHWFLRFRSNYTRLYSIGFTMEQDILEPWKSAGRQLPQPDFLSYHAVVYNQGKLKALALGDYHIQLGQGLISAGGFQMGKGSEAVMGVRKTHTGIRPYTSSNEQGFMRGAAATYQLLPSLALTTWFSRKKVDARLDTTELQQVMITALPITGLHRSPNELKNRKQAHKQMEGAHALYKSANNRLSIGATALHWSYTHALQLDTLAMYRRFQPQGAQWLNMGMHYSWLWRNWHLFGEVGVHQGKQWAGLTGVAGSIGRTVQIALLYRNYGKGFYTPYGKAFGENTNARNEEGFYIGASYSPNRRWKAQAYIDQFRFPWLRYGADAPAAGYEQLFRLTYKPSRKAYIYGQYRVEQKPLNVLSHAPIDGVLPRDRKQWQFHAYWGLSKKFSMQMRFQGSNISQGQGQSRGWAMHQELSFNHAPIKISYRTMYYGADDYDARQYVYEKDVLYAYSFPAFHGKGVRHYVLLKIRLLRSLDAWVKYSWTRLVDDRSPQKTIKWQLQWKF